jgi:hypothetical protein
MQNPRVYICYCYCGSERRKMIAKFPAENEGRDPDDAEWLEIYAAVKQGKNVEVVLNEGPT